MSFKYVPGDTISKADSFESNKSSGFMEYDPTDSTYLVSWEESGKINSVWRYFPRDSDAFEILRSSIYSNCGEPSNCNNTFVNEVKYDICNWELSGIGVLVSLFEPDDETGNKYVILRNF